MKVFSIILFCALGVITHAQQGEQADQQMEVYDFHEDEMYEKARFEVKYKESNAYTTDLEVKGAAVTPELLFRIKKSIYEKDGIFLVESLKDGMVLRIYHLEHIEIETIKHFILPFVSDFHPNERVLYYMN
ncbi:MAG: hypothetical protein HUJ25_16305 [Crocinitomicaceae bacterium]|nr:hypothetical protein [Crocinitomicaceae bacterium]